MPAEDVEARTDGEKAGATDPAGQKTGGRTISDKLADPFVKFCDQSSPLLVRSMLWYPRIIYSALILLSFFLGGGWQLYTLLTDCTEGTGCETCSILMRTRRVEDADCHSIASPNLGTTWSNVDSQLSYENNWPKIVEEMDELHAALLAMNWTFQCSLNSAWPENFLPANRVRRCSNADIRYFIDTLWGDWQDIKNGAVINKFDQLADLRRPFHRPENLRDNLETMDRSIYLLHALHDYGSDAVGGREDSIAIVPETDGTPRYLLMKHENDRKTNYWGPKKFFGFFYATKFGKDPHGPEPIDRGIVISSLGFSRFTKGGVCNGDWVGTPGCNTIDPFTILEAAKAVHPSTLTSTFQECCAQMSLTNKIAVSYAFGSVVMGVFGLTTAIMLYPFMSKLSAPGKGHDFDLDSAIGAQ